MRLLNSGDTRIDIEALGIDHTVLEKYLEGVNRPNGIVLISGPTGSGKTTTLYATLQILNEHSRNIVTVEDPIEYTLEGINQVQVRESIGLNFASAIKTFLRQDPDIIMLGEIRDLETATMAIRASLTGHLVLSTIHTNSAWGIIPRLIDMGVPSYLLADTMNLAVAQRLVRLLCPKCKESAPLSKEDLPRHFKVDHLPTQQMIPKGCDYCHYSGYKGRVGVYEIIPINDELSDAIREQELKVSHLLERAGVQTLSENAFRLFKEGKTSLKEVYPLLWRKA
jgi:general secretion pathway protein E/type IV pilus assembly protein PilB